VGKDILSRAALRLGGPVVFVANKSKGALFQNRYRSIVCEEEGYLFELVRYINLLK
jgi:hypothetical protein